MHIDQIQANLQALEAESQKPAKKKSAAAPQKTNGHTTFDAEEALRVSLARAVAAFGLEEKGVTVDSMVATVHKYEERYEGVVQ